MKNSVLIENLTAEDLREIISVAIEENLRGLHTAKKESPDYLTRKEVANLLHISLVTLTDYTKRGLIKGKRIGTRVLYDRGQIEESLREIQTLKYRRA